MRIKEKICCRRQTINSMHNKFVWANIHNTMSKNLFNRCICSPSQFLSLGPLSVSQFFKTHVISRKKMSLTLKIVRDYKHLDLEHCCIEFFPNTVS
jgi:hypothetical protein